MSPTTNSKKADTLKRVNTRIFERQDAFIKAEVKRSKGTKTEGEVTRELLDEAIAARKSS